MSYTYLYSQFSFWPHNMNMNVWKNSVFAQIFSIHVLNQRKTIWFLQSLAWNINVIQVRSNWKEYQWKTFGRGLACSLGSVIFINLKWVRRPGPMRETAPPKEGVLSCTHSRGILVEHYSYVFIPSLLLTVAVMRPPAPGSCHHVFHTAMCHDCFSLGHFAIATEIKLEYYLLELCIWYWHFLSNQLYMTMPTHPSYCPFRIFTNISKFIVYIGDYWIL